MFKTLIAFCLSRRPVVMLCLFMFAGAGYFAFTQLNIEAYPNPAPVIYIADGRRYPSYGECRARHPASDCSRAALKP